MMCTLQIKGGSWSAAEVVAVARAGGNAAVNAVLERHVPGHWERPPPSGPVVALVAAAAAAQRSSSPRGHASLGFAGASFCGVSSMDMPDAGPSLFVDRTRWAEAKYERL